jgi:hypothetical protein
LIDSVEGACTTPTGYNGRAQKGPVRRPGLSSGRLLPGLTTATGEEASVAVARVIGLEAGRLEVGRRGPGGPFGLLDVTLVLRRGTAETGETGTVAVLQPGEGADGVGVGGTQALTPRGLGVTVDLARGGGRSSPVMGSSAWPHGGAMKTTTSLSEGVVVAASPRT